MAISESLTKSDPWLAPYKAQIEKRLEYVAAYEKRIIGSTGINDFALGHDYFGLHATAEGWVLREWAPYATALYLVGDFCDWQDRQEYAFRRISGGEWELIVPAETFSHESKYKLHMHWDGGNDYRVPAWATYVVQDEATKQFDAVVWQPKKPFAWRHDSFTSAQKPLIYEAHVGMSSTEPKVATYKEFTATVLPRIKAAGYNTVQLMAVAEHPYYGSFGYHVSSFFAPSSRFGTPDEFKALVDAAHGMGLAVVMDIVHSHAVKNELEGISRYDGSYDQFFHPGERGDHAQWDSRVFDYGKPQVAHFLLSNCRYWLDEFHVDGFRFDGVTSMLYTHHGLGVDFDSYDKYFEHVDTDALAYLTLANKLIHQVKPNAITIAEDMSGMPGLAAPLVDGGAGFDYRLSMGMPDLWIKYIKEKKDEDWSVGHLYHELTQHRPEERTISYAESHDQALVGDKTLLFRLADKELYDHMMVGDDNLVIERALALHKMIRLFTASLNSGGYLNFMGNEFGHPEWIDFPREGNDWSFHYARRQWNLADDKKLKYRFLGDFDKRMLGIVSDLRDDPSYTTIHDDDHVVAYARGDYLFAFNFHPQHSFEGYELAAPAGDWKVVLSSDDKQYGGFERIDTALTYPSDDTLRLYLPSRTVAVLKRVR